MPERSSKKKNTPKKAEGVQDEDVNELATRIVDQATGENRPEDEAKVKNPAAVVLGRLGGKKGGKARAVKLSAEDRSRIARKAAEARWSKDGNKRSH